MSHAANVLRRDTSGYGIQLTMLQARALADLVEEAEQRTEDIDDWLDRLEDPLCVLVDAVEAAFEAEP